MFAQTPEKRRMSTSLLTSFCANWGNKTSYTGNKGERLVKALVFVNTEPGREKEMLQKLRETKGIKEAYVLFGVYDMVAVIEVDTVESVKEVVYANIRRMEGTFFSMSMIVIEGKVKQK